MREILKIAMAVLLLAVIAQPALAATGAPSSIHQGGKTFELCNAKSTAGVQVCDNSDGVDVYASVGAYTSFTVTFSQTSPGNSCHIYAGDYEFAATVPVSLATEGDQITTTALSSSAPTWSFTRPTTLLWAVCTFAAGTYSLNIQAQE